MLVPRQNQPDLAGFSQRVEEIQILLRYPEDELDSLMFQRLDWSDTFIQSQSLFYDLVVFFLGVDHWIHLPHTRSRIRARARPFARPSFISSYLPG